MQFYLEIESKIPTQDKDVLIEVKAASMDFVDIKVNIVRMPSNNFK